jgi:hypothetical protein
MRAAHGSTFGPASPVVRLLALLLVASSLAVVRAVPARSVAVPDDMPNQASLDTFRESGVGGWGNMTGGVVSRPYVLALSVTNAGVTTPVIVGGSTTPPATNPGDVTATVEPYNLCSPIPDGPCYPTPNRVAVSIVYAKSETVGYNFAAPTETVAPVVDANSVIDLTLALNTLGESLRWTWVNGDLLYWRTTDLGTPAATLQLRFRPAPRPWVDWSTVGGNGCTASPPQNCDLTQAQAEVLSASLVLSLDDSLDPALTGAAFATQNAFFGYLEPGGNPETGPLLTVKASSTHLESDGTTPQIGVVQAFIPSAAIVNLFGVLPADAASTFTVARSSGDGGTNDPPTYATWTTATNGSDGLFITVPGVTFSVPAYDVSQDLWFLSGGLQVGTRTTINLMLESGCTRRNPCTMTVYDLGTDEAPRYAANPRRVATFAYTGAPMVSVRSAQLPAGHLYLLYVIARRTPVASSTGYVCPGNPEACGG